MRIGIDGRMLGNTGIGRYLRNLIIHLAQQDTQNEYIVFTNNKDMQGVDRENFRFVTFNPPIPIYSLGEQYRLPVEIRRWKPDVMHYPNFDIPLVQSCPYLVTIHDLIYYLYPEQCPSTLAHYYASFMLKYATKHARMIITDSQHSKRDLMNYLQLPEEKLQVIFPAAEKSYSPRQAAEPVESTLRHKYGITRPYIFYVGKHHPYKNIKQLLYAYTQYEDIYHSFQLVIAGKRDPRRNDLYECAGSLDPKGHIRFTGNVSDEALVQLYQEAGLFVFPSLYEGFGLPPLEAMACGVPVISSNAASLPEVVGDAALLVDPSNRAELADAIRKVLTDKDLANTLRKKSIEQSQKFSWETSAREHLTWYEKIAYDTPGQN
ncbi:MAG: glycosyltransferase family 4 protein [bacterium]|nr:glycosyltransferase family 4 protein [bacterium]